MSRRTWLESVSDVAQLPQQNADVRSHQGKATVLRSAAVRTRAHRKAPNYSPARCRGYGKGNGWPQASRRGRRPKAPRDSSPPAGMWNIARDALVVVVHSVFGLCVPAELPS